MKNYCAIRNYLIRGLVVLMLLNLSACTLTQSRVKGIESVAQAPVDVVETVRPLGEGRRGFVISETDDLNAALRADFQQAVVLLENNQAEQAIELLERVVADKPALTASYINLAKAYRQTGAKEKAEESLKKALELIPGHPLASHEYGLLLRAGGRFAEARAVYETALALFPDYLPIRKNLGILCDLYMNDAACALEQFQLYHQLRPDDEEVKLWISEIKLR